ncbi:NotI family restriction endonuclease [Ruegeria sp. HKCCA5426]|uniref:NotI family restriction endonuclease n=1 Tax=Ruegeria sp. HKCCA5426 TaxID=2682985 RepID=UPI0014876F16|nr:NotI family restriction endonuclease [Ruegeria sp. HKCCA5426]
MPTKVLEFHGFQPLTGESKAFALKKWCPFVDVKCKKAQSGGVCALQAPGAAPVIICPNRLYGNQFEVILRVAQQVFGHDCDMITDVEAESRRREGTLNGREVVVYGQGYSGEVGIKAPSAEGESGSFKVDFLLASVGPNLEPLSIVAIEVQTIDTTNSYKKASSSYYAEQKHQSKWGEGGTNAGFNWENVTKRILPQIIYKGHALRREKLARHGLFFVLPDPVLQKILTRIGSSLLEYPKGPGTITFHSYQLSEKHPAGERPIELVTEFTTTVEQIAYAFVSPQNLPPLGIYEHTITDKLAALSRKKSL